MPSNNPNNDRIHRSREAVTHRALLILGFCFSTLPFGTQATTTFIGTQMMGEGYVNVSTNLFDSSFTLLDTMTFDPVSPGTNSVFDFDSGAFEQSATFDLGADGAGSMMAGADLRTGELKGAMIADNRSPNSGFSQQTTQSQIFERIHVDPFVGSTMVTLTMAMEGTESFIDGAGIASGNQFISAQITVLPVEPGGPIIQGFISNIIDGPLDGQVLELSFELFDTQTFFDVTYSLDLTQQITNRFSEIDYANTATAGITLEDGLSYTSGSGLFLTSAVPLPAAIYVFGSAVLALFGISQTRRS